MSSSEMQEHQQRALDAFRRSVTRKARQSGGTATAHWLSEQADPLHVLDMRRMLARTVEINHPQQP